jgi:hypothetical protein
VRRIFDFEDLDNSPFLEPDLLAPNVFRIEQFSVLVHVERHVGLAGWQTDPCILMGWWRGARGVRLDWAGTVR